MILLTPGPVTTAPEVRAALTQDWAPWDQDFMALYAALRPRLRDLAGGQDGRHVAFALQGSGHFVVEAAIRTFIPRGGAILIPATGMYADRMTRLAREAGRQVVVMPVPTETHVDPALVAEMLARHPEITHAGLVHSETSTGLIHDVAAVGAAVRTLGRRTLIDAISSFGALPIDMSAMPEADAVLFTSNKCLECVPGLGFAVARVDRLERRAHSADSWSFDLADMYRTALQHGWGAFRFTPPAQVVAAMRVALDLLDAEGGPPVRLARYTANMRTLHDGLLDIGLQPGLPWALQGPIVMNVHVPRRAGWTLHGFVAELKSRGVLISNFSCTDWPSLRIGCIGAIGPDDIRRAVAAIDGALMSWAA